MKKIIKISVFTIICLVTIGILIFPKMKSKDKKVAANDLINISELPDEFMNNYYEGVKDINERGNEENVLLVISEKEIENNYGASNVVEAPNNLYVLEYSSEAKKENAYSKLKDDKSLISVEKNDYSEISVGNFNSWGIEAMSLDYAKEIADEKDLASVTVAIIDTGCDVDLANKYYNGKMNGYYNVLTKSTTQMLDENGHGTHIYGTIAEGTPSNVKIMPVKVSTTGSISRLNIITAINYVTDNNSADVINMSFGSTTYSQAEYQAIEAARQKNIISVAAAGNSNTSASQYPSSLDNTISISSVTQSLQKSSFSNYGSTVTFTAPGSNIRSIMGKDAQLSKNNGNNDDDDHEIISGTSMATPHAVAAVAILKGYNKNITLENTIDLLKIHAIDLGDKSWDKYFGYGLISFNDAEFCDGNNCDNLYVFKRDSEASVKKIEISNITLTPYNYGSIYNLFATSIKIYYSQDQYITRKLWELDGYGLEIDNYDPYAQEDQEIDIKYAGYKKTVTVPYTEGYEENLGWTADYTSSSALIRGYKDNNMNIGKLYVPEKINGKNVISLIGNSDYSSQVFTGSNDYSGFKEIVLPSTFRRLERGTLTGGKFEKLTVLSNILYVETRALSDNSSLKEVDGLIMELGNYSFINDNSLTSIRLNNSISTIPKGAFEMCTNLENINLPTNLVSIEDNAFADDFRLTELIFPDGLKSIGKNAFNWVNLESIDLPNTVETIGKEAFYGTNIRHLYIPDSVTFIGAGAFENCSSLDSIEVDSNNPNYDSRNNSNALIETESNTLLKGIHTTTIPQTVTKIAVGAYSGDLRIREITIPNSVTEIEKYAFYDCNYLEEIRVPRSVETIGEYAFYTRPENNPLTVNTYTDAYAKTYAVNNKVNYYAMDHSNVYVTKNKSTYKAFETVNKNDDISSVMLTHDYGYKENSDYYEKTGSQGKREFVDAYTISYNNNNSSFRFGDTSYKVSGVNEFNIPFEKDVTVTVNKATPSYTTPTNLKGTIGSQLSSVVLPSGFTWMDGTITLNEFGTHTYKARFTPTDTTNYEIINNINLTVEVPDNRETITPSITISDKTYDGTNSIDVNTISISNLDDGEYTIVSATLTSPNAGSNTAKVKIRLSDLKYQDYVLAGGKQEEEYTVNVDVLPEKLKEPSLVNKTYTYTGEEQTVELNDYDPTKMNITGDKRTNAGEQEVTISLKNNNYMWKNNTTQNVKLTFKINKAQPTYTVPTGLSVNKGQKLSDIDLPDNFEWMNPDEKVTTTGEQTFKAKYIPTDTNNYEIVENINIVVNSLLAKTIIVPNITIQDKEYDGTNNIDVNTISISNLDEGDYTIVSAALTNLNAGVRNAKVKIRLTDEKFIDFSLQDNKQEEEYTVNVNVIAKSIIKPTPVYKTYIYNGEEQTFEVNNFDSTKMNISGNKRTNAGEQEVTISLKNNNYKWNDNTTNNITFRFVIIRIQDGWKEENGNKVYYKDGKKLTGHQTIDGYKYLFDENGYMQTGFVRDPQTNKLYFYSRANGALKYGWQGSTEGKWYQNKNGEVLIGHQTIEGNKYLFNENGFMQTGFVRDPETNKLYFYSRVNGALKYGWQGSSEGIWYQDANGIVNEEEGLVIIDGKEYYFKGIYAQIGVVNIDGSNYYFNTTKYNKEYGVHSTKYVKYYLDNTTGELQKIQRIPIYYNQKDDRWRNIRIGNSTFGSSGCVPTCLAMAYSSIKEREILPIEIGYYLYNNTDQFNRRYVGASGMAVIYASNRYGVKYKNIYTKASLKEELDKGNLVYGTMQNGKFATPYWNHAIIIYDYDESSGRVKTIASDPLNSYNNGWVDVDLIWDQKNTDPDDLTGGSALYSLY